VVRKKTTSAIANIRQKRHSPIVEKCEKIPHQYLLPLFSTKRPTKLPKSDINTGDGLAVDGEVSGVFTMLALVVKVKIIKS